MPLYPPMLRPGARIGIVAPASKPLDLEKFQRGITYLETKGFTPVVAPHVLDEYGYLAGRDADRAADLNAMFADPKIDAIICARGGYGTPRLLERLDYDVIRNNPKIFVGYSDISALQQAIYSQTELITFSGPMVAVEMGAGIDALTETYFWSLLMNRQAIYPLTDPRIAAFEVYKAGAAAGPLIGGCLSVFAPLIGSRFMPDYQGAILVLEDIDEPYYGIDRLFCQLKAVRILDQVQAIVIGQFLECEPKDPQKPTLRLPQIIEDLLGDLSIPIITNFAYGHGPLKFTIPWGANARLDTRTGTFEIVGPICADPLLV
ncbi:LD-carboxypeptidase [candidate division KSB1 bacterium]|nr:LD-carboxypeptidase [candidate division KSB1 bacterium]